MASKKRLELFLEESGSKLIEYEGYEGRNTVLCRICKKEFECRGKSLYRNYGTCKGCMRIQNRGHPQKYVDAAEKAGSVITLFKNDKNIFIMCGCCKRNVKVINSTLLKLGMCGMCSLKSNPEKIKNMKEKLASLGVEDAMPISKDVETVSGKRSYTLGGIQFTCTGCDELVTYTSDQHIDTWTGRCLSCRPDRHSQQEVNEKFEEYGFKLVGEYVERHEPVEAICPCGESVMIRLSDVVRGKRCKQCKGDRYKDTCNDRYGVSNVRKLPDVVEKGAKTRESKYGYRFPFEKNEIREKAAQNMGLLKDYIWSDGTVFIVQGYEPFFLKFLESTGRVQSRHITTRGSDMPKIKYPYEGKIRTYNPDVYLRGAKKSIVVEVKSIHTMLNREAEHQNYAKWEAADVYCESRGETFMVYFYDPKGKCIFKSNGWPEGRRLKFTEKTVEIVDEVD